MKHTYDELMQRAENISQMVNDRCQKLAREAEIDPTIWPLHAHNALVALHQGKPWPGVDYAKVKRIKYLEQHRIHKGYEIVRRYFSRVGVA